MNKRDLFEYLDLKVPDEIKVGKSSLFRNRTFEERRLRDDRPSVEFIYSNDKFWDEHCGIKHSASGWWQTISFDLNDEKPTGTLIAKDTIKIQQMGDDAIARHHENVIR